MGKVPILSFVSTSSSDKPIWWTTEALAQRLIDSGMAVRLNQRGKPMKVQLTGLLPADLASGKPFGGSQKSVAFTVRDMEVNVGATGNALERELVRQRLFNWKDCSCEGGNHQCAMKTKRAN
jgi:hypothetical protein